MNKYYLGEIECDTIEVAGFDGAIIGMRNPMDSWSKSDSHYRQLDSIYDIECKMGDNDMILAKKLINAGGEHRKFLRQIQVWADISMPRYIWQELDTYKFGTKNSCSTMHTLFKSDIELVDFYFGNDPIIGTVLYFDECILPRLNELRRLYEETKDYRWIVEMKRTLPENFIQMRTWNTNYEELFNIYKQRKNHKLKDEYKVLLDWIESLPYFKELCLE